MLFEYISMAMRCLSRPTFHLSAVDQSHSISCFWRRRSYIEQAGWLRASVGLRKTEWEGKKERREWVWQMSSTVGWSDSWLTVKAAAPLRPSLEGLIPSAFALCVPLNLLIILGETDSRTFQTERQSLVRCFGTQAASNGRPQQTIAFTAAHRGLVLHTALNSFICKFSCISSVI